MDNNIAIPIAADYSAIISLQCLKIWRFSSVTLKFTTLEWLIRQPYSLWYHFYIQTS